jgi:hypothetical protein
MMANSSTAAASAHRVRVWSCQSVRAHLTAGGVIASAGIIAGALVVVPPDVPDVTREVRSVLLAALPLPRIVPSASVVLPRLAGNDARSGLPVVELVAVDPADIAAGVVTIPKAGPTTLLKRDAGTNSQTVDASALAAPAAALSIPEALLPIVGPFILFAPIFALALLILPLNFPAVITFYVQSTVLFLTDFLSGAAFIASPLAVAANPSSAIDSSVSGPVSLTTATARDAALVAETGEPDASPPGTFSDAPTDAAPISAEEAPSEQPATEAEQIPKDSAAPTTETEAVEAEEPSMEAAVAIESAVSSEPATSPAPSADVATSEPEPVKAAQRHATPRPVVRESFKAGDRLRKRTATADDGAKRAESNPAETSPVTTPSANGDSADRASGGEGNNPSA